MTKNQINLISLSKKEYRSPEYQRLIQVQKKIGFNQKEFVALIQIERQTLYNIRDRQDSFIPSSCIKILAQKFDWLNIDWLIRGVGEIDKKSQEGELNEPKTSYGNVLNEQLMAEIASLKKRLEKVENRLALLEKR